MSEPMLPRERLLSRADLRPLRIESPIESITVGLRKSRADLRIRWEGAGDDERRRKKRNTVTQPDRSKSNDDKEKDQSPSKFEYLKKSTSIKRNKAREEDARFNFDKKTLHSFGETYADIVAHGAIPSGSR